MPNLIYLLTKIRFLSLKNTQNKKRLLQTAIFIFFSSLVLIFIWFGTSRLLIKLDSLNSAEEYSTIVDVAKSFVLVGDLLKERLLTMVLLAIFFLLCFSNIINALSNLFLSQDTDLILASPIKVSELFKARVFETILSSSWMSFIFFLPVLYAYAINFQINLFKLLPFLLALIPFVLNAGYLAIIFALLLATFFPIKQSKKVFNFLLIFFISVILILLRMLKPEKLFAIDSVSEIESFVKSLQMPLTENLPPAWISNIAFSIFKDQLHLAIEPTIYLFLSAICLLGLTNFLGQKLYLATLTKAQEQKAPAILTEKPIKKSLNIPIKKSWVKAMVYKDLLLFTRNPEIWSQTFLILAMVGLYLYNLNLLGLDSISLYSLSISSFISFLNTAFVAFITTSISMRFLFPAISLEGQAFWLLKKAPFKLTDLILFKFFFWLPLILFLGCFMTTIANFILNVPLFFHCLNLANILVLCTVNSMLGITMGAIFPNYKAENINKIFMSYGGTFYMLSSLAFIFIYLSSQSYAGILYYKFLVRQEVINNTQIFIASGLVLLGLSLAIFFIVAPYYLAKKSLILSEDSFL